MTLATGKQLGPYEILTTLGVGGMGEVYRALDRRLEREVAIKVLPAHLSADPATLARFEQEAKALAALDHSNILAVHDVGTNEGIAFVVMELLRGESLGARIRRAVLPWRESIGVALGIASGLAAAHARGVVHGDLKPDNVFVTETGQVKILDFGLARFDDIAGVHDISKAPTLIGSAGSGLAGTMQYLSPEQIRGTLGDARSDIFAFGCTLYAMLTGAPPFSGASLGEVLAAILRDPVRAVGPSIPPALDQLLHACLKKQADDRVQTARELCVALETIATTEPGFMAPRSRASTRSRGIDSLAVLPFMDTGSDPETEYLSDGLTDRIIETLSQLRQLRVMALATVLRYKGRVIDPLVVGRELDVRAVLTGRVVKRDERLTIHFELVDARDGSRLWAGQHGCEVGDLQDLQESLARQISDELQLKLLRRQEKQLSKRHTHNTEAFRLYLQGRYYWNKRSREGLLKSIECFELALQQDARFPLAIAGLADSYALLGGFTYLPPQEAYSKAKSEALRALALDPTLAEAHGSLALVKYRFDWDWAGAEVSFRRAIELKPGYAMARLWYGVYSTLMGRFETGLAEVDRALQLDPLSLVVHWTRGYSLYYARRYDAALEQYAKLLAIDPTFARVHFDIGLTHVQLGHFTRAIEEIRKGIDLLEYNPGLLATLGYAYARAGDRPEAERILAELQALSKRQYVSPYSTALVHLGLGDIDATFDWLEQSLALREDALVSLRVNPRLDPVRADPRFGSLLARIGLPPTDPDAAEA